MILLGTGTSVGVPMIGCGCHVCQSTDPRNRRTRCSAILGLPEGNLLIEIYVENSSVDVSTSRCAGIPDASRAWNSTRFSNNADNVAQRMLFEIGECSGGGPTLRISGDCPGRVTVAWANATPSRPMGIALANSTGSYTLPGGICAGTQLGLSSSGLQLVYSGNTGANGSGQVSSNAGTGACRKYLQMIVVDGSPCTTSNVVQIP